MQPPVLQPFVLYQSERLRSYTDRLIHGFTGKPITLGGPDFTAEEIAAQRKRLCETVNLNYERLTLPHQIHSDQYLLNEICRGDQGDALIVTEPGIPAMVQVADCVPILLYDPVRHAGAAVHAGWRGTAKQVVMKVAQALIADHGCKAENLIAAIGPAVGGCCYEISLEVASQVSGTLPDQPSSKIMTINAAGNPQIDLKTVNRLQLESMGITQVEILPDCTLCEPERLWSYRRGEGGRQVAFLQLLP